MVTAAGASSFTVAATDSETPLSQDSNGSPEHHHHLKDATKNWILKEIVGRTVFLEDPRPHVFEVTRYAARNSADAVRARKM
jgi:hypothetical protein